MAEDHSIANLLESRLEPPSVTFTIVVPADEPLYSGQGLNELHRTFGRTYRNVAQVYQNIVRLYALLAIPYYQLGEVIRAITVRFYLVMVRVRVAYEPNFHGNLLTASIFSFLKVTSQCSPTQKAAGGSELPKTMTV